MALGQTNNYPYYLKSLAGTFPLGDGGPATSALLYSPFAAVPDASGNLFILDSDNYLIRKVAPNGTISTIAPIYIYGYDMKLAPDGSLYVAGSGQVIKISLNGTTTVIAGTGTEGYGGDGGPAAGALVGECYGIALDAAGNVYFTDNYYPSARVREVTNGQIRTIAGTGKSGFNGDNQPATSAELYFPAGIAVDGTGNIYVADTDNYRIRKFTAGGTITTIAGIGSFGQPGNGGPAPNSTVGTPEGLWIDSSNNLYFTDDTYGDVLKISTSGTMTRVAGDNNPYATPGDNLALDVSLLDPESVSLDSAGEIFIAETGTHQIREVLPNGNLITVAGKIHFGGDGGPAVSALLNNPDDVALDLMGDVFIADGENFRIREVTPDGTIATVGGNGIPGMPTNGIPLADEQLFYIYSMATDSKGVLYFATFDQVYKVGSSGTVTVVAGSGNYGNTGDGGPATSATFEDITGIAVDPSFNVYVADSVANRVRMISAATGTISAFAGTGTTGSTGDGGLATSALLNLYLYAPLAADQKGNVYIGDGYNYKVRMVNPAGIISTVVGNGTFGRPNGVSATSTGFSAPASMSVDSAGNLYIASNDYGDIYEVAGGIITRIEGSTGTSSLADGTPALSAYFFSSGIKIDASGDIFAADLANNTIRELILNSPTGFSISGGNNQAGQLGQPLAQALKVSVPGRAGLGVQAVTVNFAITSGSGTLSAASTQTDATGSAGVALTLGTTPGPVVVTATAVGTGLPPVQFTETAAPVGCTALPPVVTSTNSAGDFGGGSTFASGSWLEIHGSNLAIDTRTWGTADFQGSNAPTALDGSSALINGIAGFMYYISPTQVNVQAPADATLGSVPITVSNCAGTSVAVMMQKAAVAPGLLAPADFNVGGKQYLVALFPNGNYVGNPGLVSGVNFVPAAPGNSITAYGAGFGNVNPSISPGVVVGESNSIPNLTIAFGTTPATVTYAGLAPGAVGLYQFNFVVPNIANGDYAINFELNGSPVQQVVYLTVQQ